MLGILVWASALAVTAPPAPSRLTVSLDAGDAAVWVDGVAHGRTPAVLRLEAGVHAVRVVREDGRGFVQRVCLGPGRRARILARAGTLEPVTTSTAADLRLLEDASACLPRPVDRPAHLTIGTARPADVWIDGVFVGTAPLHKHAVAPGRRVIKVVDLADRVPQTSTVELGPGEERRVRFGAPEPG